MRTESKINFSTTYTVDDLVHTDWWGLWLSWKFFEHVVNLVLQGMESAWRPRRAIAEDLFREFIMICSQ